MKQQSVERYGVRKRAARGLVAVCHIAVLLVAVGCNSERDREVAGLIRLKEARKGLEVQTITIEAAKTTSNGELIYYNFTAGTPELQKRRDTIMVAQTLAGNLREIP